MKKFINKILCQIPIVFSLLFILTLFPWKLGNMRVDKQKNMVVIGNSHSECAYNDKIINGLYNLSRSEEDYFNSYYKLKEFLNQNPQTKTVFIEFSNSDIGKERNTWIWGTKGKSSKYHRKLAKYALFMDLEGFQFLYKNNPAYVMGDIKYFFKNNIELWFNGFNHLNNNIGGYLYLERNNSEFLISNYNKDSLNTYSNGISDVNLMYLRKMIEVCDNKEVDAFLVRTPLHSLAGERFNEATFSNIKDSLFADIELLDFIDFPLKDNQFGDFKHLNYKGAKLFSEYFDNLLKAGLLNTYDKQNLINKEINVKARNIFLQVKVGKLE